MAHCWIDHALLFLILLGVLSLVSQPYLESSALLVSLIIVLCSFAAAQKTLFCKSNDVSAVQAVSQELLPAESAPLSGAEAGLSDQVRARLRTQQLESHEELSEAVLMQHVRAFKQEPDFPNAVKTSQILTTNLGQLRILRQQPPMDSSVSEACRQIWPRCVSGHTRHGHPVYWDCATMLSKSAVESKFGNLRDGFEHLRRYDLDFNLKLADHKSQLAQRHRCILYRHVTVVDLSHFDYNSTKSVVSSQFIEGLRNINSGSPVMYPDTLERMYLVNAGYLARAGWDVLKRIVHPVTQAKIVVLGADWLACVQAETGILLAEVPSEFGGAAPRMAELPQMP